MGILPPPLTGALPLPLGRWASRNPASAAGNLKMEGVSRTSATALQYREGTILTPSRVCLGDEAPQPWGVI